MHTFFLNLRIIFNSWTFLEIWIKKTLLSSVTKISYHPLDRPLLCNINKLDALLFERADAETEAPVFWPPDANSWFVGKDPDAGKDWRQKEKRVAEDEMIGWHHRVNGHELGQNPGDGRGQRNLACWSPWGCRVGHALASEQQQHLRRFTCRTSVLPQP